MVTHDQILDTIIKYSVLESSVNVFVFFFTATIDFRVLSKKIDVMI